MEAQPKSTTEVSSSLLPPTAQDLSRENHAGSFPLHVLPRRIQAFINECARSLSASAEMVALPALIVLGTAIGNTRLIRLKPDWLEPPILWGAVIAPSGSIKSPALSKAMGPLQRLDSGERRTWTADVTVERLAMLLEQHSRGVVIVRDELSGWVRSMNQYRGGKGADRQFYLSTWSATSIKIDRKGQDKQAVTVSVPRPYLSVVGCIPPDVLGVLEDEGGQEDGFLARFLFCWPTPVPVRWSRSSISAETRGEYENLVEELFAIPWEGQATELPLTCDAQEYFIAWHDAMSEEAEADSCSAFVRASYSKLKGYCGRLALIHALGTDPKATEIGLESIKAAETLVSYFKVQAGRIAPVLTPFKSSTIEKCKAEIRRKLSASRFLKKRELQKNSAFSADIFNKALEELLEPEVQEIRKGEYCLKRPTNRH